jgi:hypothetical protein
MASAKVGSIAGAVVIGQFMDRLGSASALVVTFDRRGRRGDPRPDDRGGLRDRLRHPDLFPVDSSFGGVHALAASSYPPSMRASASGSITGWAWFLGGGDTMASGYLVASPYPVDRAAFLLAMPLLMGAGALFG